MSSVEIRVRGLSPTRLLTNPYDQTIRVVMAHFVLDAGMWKLSEPFQGAMGLYGEEVPLLEHFLRVAHWSVGGAPDGRVADSVE